MCRNGCFANGIGFSLENSSKRLICDLISVTVRPTVKMAFFYDIDFIRGDFVSKVITAHFRCPNLSGPWIGSHEDGVSESGCVPSDSRAIPVQHHDGRTVAIGFPTCIAARSYRYEYPAVRKSQKRTREVPSASRERKYLPGVGNPNASRIVIIAYDLIGFRHV